MYLFASIDIFVRKQRIINKIKNINYKSEEKKFQFRQFVPLKIFCSSLCVYECVLQSWRTIFLKIPLQEVHIGALFFAKHEFSPVCYKHLSRLN